MKNSKVKIDPSSRDFWATAPEGTTHFIPPHTVGFCDPCWVKKDGDTFYYCYYRPSSPVAEFRPWVNGGDHYDKMIANPFADDACYLPKIGEVCYGLWNSCGNKKSAEYLKVEVLAHYSGKVVYVWTEGPRAGEIQSDPHTGHRNIKNPVFMPVEQENAKTDPNATVPKWKFDVLVREIEMMEKRIGELQHVSNKMKMFVDKDVWFWQNDSENHLNSLVCPIVIDAETLRRLLK
jgi:hypothetical protein